MALALDFLIVVYLVVNVFAVVWAVFDIIRRTDNRLSRVFWLLVCVFGSLVGIGVYALHRLTATKGG